MTKTFVSIIMPAYNADKYIEQSINSVLDQTFKEWELIIVDDGSTDSTAKIVKEYCSKDSRVVYIYQQNKKLPAARNTGIKQSNSKYIAFLDADDLWVPDKLEKQLLVFDNKKEVDLVFTHGYILNEESQKLSDYPTLSGKLVGKEIYKIQYSANYIPVLSVLFKREWIDRIGLQDENLIYGCEDWDYWLRMALNGATFYGLSDKLFKYRIHEGGMSRKFSYMKYAEFTALYKNIDYRFLDKELIYQRLFRLMEANLANLVATNHRDLALKEVGKLLKLKLKLNHLFIYIAILINWKAPFNHTTYLLYPGKLILRFRKIRLAL